MKKIIIFMLALLLLTNFDVLAAQFEDYEWGMSMDEIKNMIISKQKNFIPGDNEDVFVYTDNILNNECRVILSFTPKSKKLAEVAIMWDTAFVGGDLKDMLIKKYGIPMQPNKFIEQYMWPPYGKHEGLYLDYSFGKTYLYYRGGQYDILREKEHKEQVEKEIDKF